ncbi:Glutaconyl-CoA decarboxylase subunit gamma [bacterium HR20]|nr:Glutaconyl-CoA decarboxylase subunit gamma [bacterium HR20]
MPGLIKAVNIAEGASVRRGESIIVLEAMKMENLLRAPMAGVVRSLAVVSGQTVEKGDLLCTIELDGQLERQSDG